MRRSTFEKYSPHFSIKLSDEHLKQLNLFDFKFMLNCKEKLHLCWKCGSYCTIKFRFGDARGVTYLVGCICCDLEGEETYRASLSAKLWNRVPTLHKRCRAEWINCINPNFALFAKYAAGYDKYGAKIKKVPRRPKSATRARKSETKVA